MIKFFIAAFALAAPLLSQTTVALRTGAGSGVVTSCTNATPIVCKTAAPHGFTANDRVVLENILGNTAANGTFYVSVPSSTTFGLYSASGPKAAVAGNGAWVAGSNLKLAGKVSAFKMVDHPRIFMPGPTAARTLRYRCWTTPACLTNITVNASTNVATANITGYDPSRSLAPGKKFGVWRSATSSLNGAKTVVSVTSTTITWTDKTTRTGTYTDASISEYAWPDATNNPAWDQLVSGDNTFNSTYNTPNAGTPVLESYRNAALRWWITGNAASLTRAMWIIDHPEGIAQGTMACDESRGVSGCGAREQVDYGRAALSSVAAVYSLIYDQLSGGQKTAFADKMLNDPQMGGCSAYVPTTLQTGTVGTGGTTTLSGSGGTAFTSFAVGGAIWADWDGAGGSYTNRSRPRIITAITDDDTLTLHEAGGSASGQAYWYSRPWQSGDCGVIAVLKHHSAGVFGDPTTYPSAGGHYEAQEGAGMGQYLNLAETALVGYFHMGIALADDDARAVRLLQSSSLYMHDYTLAYDMKTFTGIGHLGGVYGLARGAMPVNTCSGFMDAFIGYPDLRCSNWESTLQSMIYSWGGIATTTGTGVHARLGLGGATVDGAYFLGETSPIAQVASPTWQAYWRQWLINSGTWVSRVLATNQSKAAGMYVLGVDPQVKPVDYTAVLPLAKLFNTTQYSLCASLGMAKCLDGVSSSSHRYDHYMSRSSWSNPSVLAILYGGTTAPDHFAVEHAGSVYVTRANNVLIGGPGNDGSGGGGNDPEHLSAPYLGTMRAGEANTTRPIATIPRSHTAAGIGYAMTEHSGAWATPPTGAHRHLVHIGEFIGIYDWVSGAAAGARIHVSYPQNGQGSEGSTALSSGKVTSQSASEGLMSLFSAPGGATTLKLTADKPHGNIYRVKICPSVDSGSTCNAAATGLEIISSNRVVAGVTDAALTTTEYNPDANWTGVQLAGNGNAAVMMFSRGGLATRTSVPAVTTTATAPYFAAGLAPGTYNVLLGGSPVSGCAGLTVSANDNSIFCASVSAGSVSVAAGS